MAGDQHEVFFEVYRLGSFAKVSAIDSVTGTEISLIAPANASESTLRAAALQKLDYVLAKNARKK